MPRIATIRVSGEPVIIFPLVESPPASSIPRSANRSTSDISPVCCLADNGDAQQCERQRRIADGLEQPDKFRTCLRCLGHATVEDTDPTRARPSLSPVTADRQRRYTGRATPRSRSRRRCRELRVAVAHNRVRGAMRIVGRSGSASGSRSATLPCPAPAGHGSGVVAEVRPRPRPHVPLVRGMQITGRLEMLRDQCCVLIGRALRLDHGRPGACVAASGRT